MSSILFLSEYSQGYGEILDYLSKAYVVSGHGIGLEVYLHLLGTASWLRGSAGGIILVVEREILL